MPNPTRQRMGLGVASVTLGFLGMMFVFLAPLGAMVSAAGLLCGIAGCFLAGSRRASGFWWSLGGTLLSLAALIVDLSLTDFSVLRERFGSSLFGL
jgi:hypothetical protein